MATISPEEHVPGKQAVKFDGGKIRMDLLPPQAMQEIAKVFTYGSKKYDDPDDRSPWKQNWRAGTGMSDSQFDAAGDRHRTAHNAGHDFDDDTQLFHLAHFAANAIMRLETFMRFPGTDDRDTPTRRLVKHRIALDIDDVIADTWKWMADRLSADPSTESEMYHYNWPQGYEETWFGLGAVDLLSIPPKEDGRFLPFEPVAYITARPESMRDATQQWLEMHNFPGAKLFMTHDKVGALKEVGATLHIDDRIHYVYQAQEAGIGALLMDRPHNAKYDVGHKRIYSLADVVDRI